MWFLMKKIGPIKGAGIYELVQFDADPNKNKI